MMAKSSQLKEHVAALQKALAEIAASQAVMGELLWEEHDAYVLTALKLLREYFSWPRIKTVNLREHSGLRG